MALKMKTPEESENDTEKDRKQKVAAFRYIGILFICHTITTKRFQKKKKM